MVGPSIFVYSGASRTGLCPWDNRGKANSCPPPRVHKNLPHTWTTMRQQRYESKAEMWSVRAMHTFSSLEISGTMLQRYVLTCGRSVTAFSAPPRSRRLGQGPRSPHPKASPGCKITNKCSRVLSALVYLPNYPEIFRQLTAIFRGLHVPLSYSSFVCVSGGWGLRLVWCGQLPWNAAWCGQL
jgi:hypothetical protein